jgi:hypothetical protein
LRGTGYRVAVGEREDPIMIIHTTNTNAVIPPDSLWHMAIDGIVVLCQKTPGLRARIYRRMCREFTRESGKPWSRTQIDNYLHADPKKRHQPGLGVGLALVLCAQRETAVPQTFKQAMREADRGELEDHDL